MVVYIIYFSYLFPSFVNELIFSSFFLFPKTFFCSFPSSFRPLFLLLFDLSTYIISLSIILVYQLYLLALVFSFPVLNTFQVSTTQDLTSTLNVSSKCAVFVMNRTYCHDTWHVCRLTVRYLRKSKLATLTH